MPNTLNTDLVTAVVRNVTQIVLQKRLIALGVFSKDFSTDLLAPKKQVLVPIATATGAAETNPTNYESGDTTIGKIPVTPGEIHKGFGLTNAELNNGFRLEQLLEINLHAFANAILDAVLTPVTVANFGAAVVEADAVDVDTDTLKTLWAAIPDAQIRNLVLDAAYYAQFLPANKDHFTLGQGAYGFDRFDMNNRWDGAEDDVRGFVCDPAAVAIASGLPIVEQAVKQQMLLYQTITVPMLGITAAFQIWGSLATRNVRASFNVMIGSAVGDATRLKLLKQPA